MHVQKAACRSRRNRLCCVDRVTGTRFANHWRRFLDNGLFAMKSVDRLTADQAVDPMFPNELEEAQRLRDELRDLKLSNAEKSLRGLVGTLNNLLASPAARIHDVSITLKRIQKDLAASTEDPQSTAILEAFNRIDQFLMRSTRQHLDG
jgi:hypothetical protein